MERKNFLLHYETDSQNCGFLLLLMLTNSRA
uniref:Uncharacterized protein n=1 Tax=Arundo donax TaxID=35708 RepID=A0A0A9G9E2_ARUDO